MDVQLHAVSMSELPIVQKVFQASFHPILKRYQDTGSNPALMPFKQLRILLKMKHNHLMLIKKNEIIIGAVNVTVKNQVAQIGSLAVLPAFQNEGLGRAAMLAIEEEFSEIDEWQLTTILQEDQLTDFCESLGYRAIGEIENVHTDMSLVHFNKKVRKPSERATYYQFTTSSI